MRIKKANIEKAKDYTRNFRNVTERAYAVTYLDDLLGGDRAVNMHLDPADALAIRMDLQTILGII